VKSINNYCFYSCSSLTRITIPDSVTLIGERAFANCSKLTDVLIPDSVISIGSNAFTNCTSFKRIIIPDKVTQIRDFTFSLCSNMISITIPESVTSIGNNAFQNCSSLTTITIPKAVTSIGDYAFRNCSSLTTMIVPEGITSIGKSTFYGCSNLMNVTLPPSISTIGDYAFSYCSNLETLIIPDGVTSLGSYAFSFCSGFVNIIIPECVTSIKGNAFMNCTSLKTVFYQGSQMISTSNAFYRCNALETVCVSPDYSYSSFCNIPVTRNSDLCQQFEKEFNNCYKGFYDDNGAIIEEKRKNATEWEGMSNGCAVYRCDNSTGKLSWSLCNSSDGIDLVCFEGECQEKDSNGETGWAVEVDVEPTEWTEVNYTNIFDEIGFDDSEVRIGLETDNNGNVIRVIIYCDDAEIAKIIVSIIEEIEQSSECTNLLCRRKAIRIKNLYDWNIMSFGDITKNSIFLSFLMIALAVIVN